jgi:3-phosphoshikimate 1-carboxyvinyltransferase
MSIVEVPGSKSATARALFLAAGADGSSVLRRPLISDDTEAFAEGVERLGYPVDRLPGQWAVQGSASGPTATVADVYCRDAATASRFLPALAALGHGSFRFDASKQMRARPVGPLTSALRALGVEVRHDRAEGHLPLTVLGRGIEGGHLRLDAGLSSQFLTAILLAGPLMDKGLTVTVTDLVSAPYVEMTLAMMGAFGSEVTREGDTYHAPPQPYRATDYAIEPDASTASYFLAAAAVTGRTVTIPGLGARSLQGDLGFVDVLRQMGADVELTDDAVTVTGPDQLGGVTVNMRDISDTMPTLTAIAPFADRPVRIEDVYNTRVKECDRLDACATNLRALGIRVETGRDWIQIWPGTPTAAHIACHGDHRIAMSFSITGLHTPGLTLDDPGCVKKTFPGFHDALNTLKRTWTHISD